MDDLVEAGTSPVIMCRPDAPINQVARQMLEANVGCVIVVDDSLAPMGIVTDRDLVVRGLAKDLDYETYVQEVMTENVASINQHASYLDAARQMSVHGCRRLPVIGNEDNVMAVISLDDLYRAEGAVTDQLDNVLASEDGGKHSHPYRAL